MNEIIKLKEWAEENHFSDFKDCYSEKDILEVIDRMNTSREICYPMTEKMMFENGLDKCVGYGIIELTKGAYICPIKIIYMCEFEDYLPDCRQFGNSGATMIGWVL